MVFALYFLGTLVLISGFASVASALGAAPAVVTACAAALAAIALAIGAANLRRTAR